MKKAEPFLLVFGVVWLWQAATMAQDNSMQRLGVVSTNSNPEAHGALSLRWENDAFAGTDRDYSNGTALSLLLRGRGRLGGFWDVFGNGDREYFQAYELGQVIVTPMDTSLTVPDPNDRPYAGLLYVDLGTAIRHENLFHGFKVAAGVAALMGDPFDCPPTARSPLKPHAKLFKT